MKIAITGTRGIPNRYGGFEQFAERLSAGLADKDHDIWVYNTHSHSFAGNSLNGVKLIRRWSPEGILGSAANYPYDYLCMKDAIRRGADVILECGYPTAAPSYTLLNFGKTKLVTLMDGMEWQRNRWNALGRKMIIRTEKKTVKHSDAVVCDHPGVGRYIREKYSVVPAVIPYGAEIRTSWNENVLRIYGEASGIDFTPGTYFLVVARLIPENNIKMILDGFLSSDQKESMVVVGDYNGGYGRKLYREYSRYPGIQFSGGLFDQEILDHLRHYSRGLFHGHSVGGTNPSLLEAMAAGASVFAHDNLFNRYVLGEGARFFKTPRDVKNILLSIEDSGKPNMDMIHANLNRIRSDYQWEMVIEEYENLFLDLVST